MELHEPTAEEREEMANQIQITLSDKKTFAQIMDDLFNIEYPQIDRENRKFIEETIRRIAGKLPEDQIKKKARSFIDEVMGADPS